MHADGQQVRAVAGHDELRPCGHGRGDHVVIVNIVGDDARHIARCHERCRVAVGTHQLLNRYCGIGSPPPKPRQSKGIAEFG